MRKRAVPGLLIGSLLTASASAATPVFYAHVEAVQPPAWVLRASGRTALAAGAPLYAGDRYLTGAQARLHLALDDGSIVKLGEGAEFGLPTLELRPETPEQKPLLKGALQLVKGAFRFTTRALGKLRRREIEVAIGPTITAGIRGTDIWGKSDPTQELLCLIEGKLRIRSPGHAAATMDQAQSYYVVPHGQAPLPVAAAPPDQLASWMPQTELVADQPALHAGGRWSLVLAQYLEAPRARARAAQLDALGYPVVLVPRPSRDSVLHALVMEGFRRREDAQAFGVRLQAVAGFIKQPQVLPP